METSLGELTPNRCWLATKRMPLGHHARGTVSASADPALVVADQHAAGKSPLAILRVGFVQRD